MPVASTSKKQFFLTDCYDVKKKSKKKVSKTVSPGLLKKHYSEDEDSGFTDCDESSEDELTQSTQPQLVPKKTKRK